MEEDQVKEETQLEAPKETEEVVEEEVVETDAKKTDEATPPPSGESDLMSRLEELERSNAGLKRAVSEERRGKQEVKGKLEQINSLLAESMQRKAEQPKEKAADLPKIPVEVDENGNITIDPKYFKDLMKSQLGEFTAPVKEIQEQVAATRQSQEQERAFNKLVSEVLSEDDAYQSAYQKIQRGATWLNNQVVQLQEEHGIKGFIDPDTALDALSGTVIETEFNKAFPDLDFERTMKAYDSKYSLRMALRSATVKPTKLQGKPGLDPEKAKKVLGKPNSLARARDQKNVQGGISEDTLSGLSYEDIDNLTPAERDKLMKVMEKLDI